MFDAVFSLSFIFAHFPLFFHPSNSYYFSAINGLSDGTVDKMLAIAAAYAPLGFLSASDLNRSRAEVVRLTTGSREVDNMLGGASNWVRSLKFSVHREPVKHSGCTRWPLLAKWNSARVVAKELVSRNCID